VLRHTVQEDRHFDGAPTSAIRTIYDEVGRTIRTERLTGVGISFELAGEIGKTTFTPGSETIVSSTETVYDYAGRMDMTRDASDRWTKYEYDDAGRQWRVRNFVSVTGTDTSDTINTIYDYDLNGNQKWLLDATHFDAIKTTLPGTVTAAGWRSAIFPSHQGRLTRSTYDNFNRVTRVDLPRQDLPLSPSTQAAAAYSESRYDDLGCRWLEIDADRKATAFVYNGLGRLNWVITDVHPDNTTSLPTDPLNKDYFAYSWGVRQADSTVTRYQHDELGNLVVQTDANQRATRFEYDELGRRTKRTLPGNVLRPDNTQMAAEEIWMHDYTSSAQGSKVNKTRHRDFNGRYSLITHDVVGRVMERRPDGKESWASALPTGGDRPVSFAYSAAGQRIRMTDAGGTTRYAYDDQNRLRIKQAPQGTLYYTYDTAGKITEISARRNYTFASSTDSLFNEVNLGPATDRPEGAQMAHQYDARNRLWKTFSSPGAGLAATYGYGPAGELNSVTYANNLTTTYAYNGRYHLRRVRTAVGANTVPVANFDHDEAGQVIAPATPRATWGAGLLSLSGRRNRMDEKIESATRSVNYGYDRLNRLSSESVGASSITYDSGAGYEATGYDRVGNRGSRTVTGSAFPSVTAQSNLTYDQNDRVDNDASASTPSTLFDANGNRTAYNGWTYAYDFENWLISAISPTWRIRPWR
jgi:YD repeat-containing protein